MSKKATVKQTSVTGRTGSSTESPSSSKVQQQNLDSYSLDDKSETGHWKAAMSAMNEKFKALNEKLDSKFNLTQIEKDNE